MLHSTIHNRHLRLLTAIFGMLISACGTNLFIVPIGFYSSGLMGACQVIRTLLVRYTGLQLGSFDIAGLIYYALNIPLFFIAYKELGKTFLGKTLACTTASTLFLSLIPIPSTPLVSDPLTCCLLGSICVGTGAGLALTCGCSGGGLDIIGLCLTKRGTGFTVGRFSLSFNAVLYTLCFFLFDVSTVIYSVIYMVFTSILVDRSHQQNINVQVMIFTKNDSDELPHEIMTRAGRGVTYWEGTGAYTKEGVRILCVCVSKYEIDDLKATVCEIDPHAFFMVQEGIGITGNFLKKLG